MTRAITPYNVKPLRRLPDYLTREQVDALMTSIPLSPRLQSKARLLFLLMWRAGLRISEATRLTWADVALDDSPTLLVRSGKGRMPRRVPIHPELGEALKVAYAYTPKRSGGLIIAGNNNRPLHRGTVWRWLKKTVAEAVRLGRLPSGMRITPHVLRHSAARHWLAHGVPITVVQRWLGHARLWTTLIYLEILPDPRGDMQRIP